MRAGHPPTRRTPAVVALVTAVALAGCGSSGRRAPRPPSPQQQSAQYAAAAAAFRSGDYDRAINGFQSLGGFRDARQRLVTVKAAAAATLLTRARSKLAAGHPRAAVALAQTATSRYGDTSGAGRALLAQAQRAQALHHRQQLAGKAPG